MIGPPVTSLHSAALAAKALTLRSSSLGGCLTRRNVCQQQEPETEGGEQA